MKYSRLRQNLHEWIGRRGHLRGISFRENLSPTNSPDDDYRVEYEAVFEPEDLNKARLEFWSTEDGCISVGFENYDRFKNVTQLHHWRSGFIGGHEPSECSDEYVLLMLDLVSGGSFSISYTAKFGLLLDLYICLSADNLAVLSSKNKNVYRWIKAEKLPVERKSCMELNYAAW
jgi:hypothetical protein